MKSTLAVLLLCVATQAAARGNGKETLCLSIGEFAGLVAGMRESGRSEQSVIDSVTDPAIKAGATDVVRFVYTMELKPAEARRTAYLKCMATDFGVNGK